MPVVVAHPMARLAEFRRIIATPDQHPEAVVLDACEQLMRYGDWIDHERGRALLFAIARRAQEEINAHARRVQRRTKATRLAASGAISAFIFLAVLVLIDALGRLFSNL